MSASAPLGVYLINESPRVTADSVEAEFQITTPVAGVRCFLRSQFDRVWQSCKYILCVLLKMATLFCLNSLPTGPSGHITFPNLRPGLCVLKIRAYNRTNVATVKRGFVVNSDPNYCSLVLVNRGVTLSKDSTSALVEVNVYGPATQLSCVLNGGMAYTCKNSSVLFLQMVLAVELVNN